MRVNCTSAQVGLHNVLLGGIKNAGSGFVPGRDLWRGPKGHGEVTEVTREVTERSQPYFFAHFITRSIEAWCSVLTTPVPWVSELYR